MKEAMQEPSKAEHEVAAEGAVAREKFVPQYIVTATKLPTGAIEIAVNTNNIEAKIDYILEAYDDDMRLKANPDVVIQNIMVV